MMKGWLADCFTQLRVGQALQALQGWTQVSNACIVGHLLQQGAPLL